MSVINNIYDVTTLKEDAQGIISVTLTHKKIDEEILEETDLGVNQFVVLRDSNQEGHYARIENIFKENEEYYILVKYWQLITPEAIEETNLPPKVHPISSIARINWR